MATRPLISFDNSNPQSLEELQQQLTLRQAEFSQLPIDAFGKQLLAERVRQPSTFQLPTFQSILDEGHGSTKALFEKAMTQLRSARSAMRNGELTFVDYVQQAEPFLQEMVTGLNRLSTFGAGPATEAKGFGQALQTFVNLQGGTIGQGGSFGSVKIPFSARELPSLPENVLPTSEELNQGLIPQASLQPGFFEKIKQREDEFLAPLLEQEKERRKTVIGDIQTRIDALTPTTDPESPGTDFKLPPPTTTVRDPLTGDDLTLPLLDDPGVPVADQTQDQAFIEQEARRQAEQNRRAFEAARALRSQSLEETARLLAQQRGQAFEQFVPQAAEQLQTRGLLQTSELENVLGREQARLQQATEGILGQARLAGTQQDIDAINRILGSRQSLQQAGLERRFSLQDFEKQAELAKQLGAQATPQVGGGKGSRFQSGGAAIGGLLGGALSAPAGGVGVPAGISAGTSLGSVIGSLF